MHQQERTHQHNFVFELIIVCFTALLALLSQLWDFLFLMKWHLLWDYAVLESSLGLCSFQLDVNSGSFWWNYINFGKMSVQGYHVRDSGCKKAPAPVNSKWFSLAAKNDFLAAISRFATTTDCQKSTTAADYQKSSLGCIPRLKSSKLAVNSCCQNWPPKTAFNSCFEITANCQICEIPKIVSSWQGSTVHPVVGKDQLCILHEYCTKYVLSDTTPKYG